MKISKTGFRFCGAYIIAILIMGVFVDSGIAMGLSILLTVGTAIPFTQFLIENLNIHFDGYTLLSIISFVWALLIIYLLSYLYDRKFKTPTPR